MAEATGGIGDVGLGSKIIKGLNTFIHGRDRSLDIKRDPLLTPDQILKQAAQRSQEVYIPQPTLRSANTSPSTTVEQLASEKKFPPQISGGSKL